MLYPKSFSLNSTCVLVSFFGLFALCYPKLCFDSVPVNALSQQTLSPNCKARVISGFLKSEQLWERECTTITNVRFRVSGLILVPLFMKVQC